jgi:hypothetical protein
MAGKKKSRSKTTRAVPKRKRYRPLRPGYKPINRHTDKPVRHSLVYEFEGLSRNNMYLQLQRVFARIRAWRLLGRRVQARVEATGVLEGVSGPMFPFNASTGEPHSQWTAPFDVTDGPQALRDGINEYVFATDPKALITKVQLYWSTPPIAKQ